MVASPVTDKLETADIQGLVTRGFGSLPEARFLLLEVREPALARRYLRDLAGRVNTARKPAEHFVLQVAMTAPGLDALGVPRAVRDTFAREFLEGMDDDVRAESLGDRGDNDPSKWEWGRTTPKPPGEPEQRPVHVLLMLYAENASTLAHQLLDELKLIEDAFRVVHKETTMLRDQKEHFGWADGLSMPKFEGVPKDRPRKKKQQEWWTDPIKPGEFVLGYPNEYDAYSESPSVELVDDPGDVLPKTPDGNRKDLGRNGTYLVYREMTQDVLGFWKRLAEVSREPGEDAAERAIVLGSKMVGRWPGGAPISTIDRDDPRHAKDNLFTYADDKIGLGCPLGAHIRRANPRAVLALDRDEPDSTTMARKHQMIRRGRAFGPAVSEDMNPRSILDKVARPDATTNARRGLHFLCLVGNISRQFEFVQRAWIHSANFLGLYKDGDPISAARRRDGNANDEFTCQAEPLRRKYKELPQFTTLVGGAYFFLPGIRALRFLAKEP